MLMILKNNGNGKKPGSIETKEKYMTKIQIVAEIIENKDS